MNFPVSRSVCSILGILGLVATQAIATPSWTLYDESNSGLADNWCGTVRIDPKGDVWIGATTAGLIRFDGTSWKTWDMFNSNIIYDMIHTLDIDASGRVWVATYDGLSMFDGTTFTNYDTTNAGFHGNSVDAVEVAPDGKIWIATHAGSFDQKGVTVFDGKTWNNLGDMPANARSDEVNSIAFISPSTAWIGSLAGLVRYDGEFSFFPKAYTGQWHSDELAVDDRGNLWSTGFDALLKYDGATWKTFDYQEKLGIDPNTYCTIGPSGDDIWLGCGRKLLRFDRSSERVAESFDSTNSPIGSRSIWSVALDKQGVLWMGTSGGLLKMDPNGTGAVSKSWIRNSRVFRDLTGRNLSVRFSDARPRDYALHGVNGDVAVSGSVSTDRVSIDLSRIPRGAFVLSVRSREGEVATYPVVRW